MKIYYFALSATSVFFCAATAVSSSSGFAAAGATEEDSTETKIETNQSGDSNTQYSLFYSNHHHHHLHNDYQKVLEKFAVQANKVFETKTTGGGSSGSDSDDGGDRKSTNGNGATRNIGHDHGQDHGHRHRMLQSLTQYEFDSYFCDVFEVELGARCSCDAGSLTMKCDLGDECMTYPSTFFPEGTATDCPAGGDDTDDEDENGSGGEVCFDTSMMMKLSQSGSGGMLDIDSLEMVMVYTGMDYSAERVIMWPTGALSGTSNSKCEMYYSIGDLEYKCNSCRMCTGEAVTFDCSNISPDFSAVCINVNNMDAVNDLMFDYCPVGGAPQPTTPSVGPAPQPITVGSGSSSISKVTSSSSSFIRPIILVPVVVYIVVATAVAGI